MYKYFCPSLEHPKIICLYHRHYNKAVITKIYILLVRIMLAAHINLTLDQTRTATGLLSKKGGGGQISTFAISDATPPSLKSFSIYEKL